MSYRFEPDEPIADGLRRIAAEQIDRALSELDDPNLPKDETVHQVRKRCKKLRGIIRLVRPGFGGYRDANARFRDAARALSGVRDARVLLETYDHLMKRYDRQVNRRAFASIRAELTRRLDRLVEEDLDLPGRLAAFRVEMQSARRAAARWEIEGRGFDAVAGGLAKTYRRARAARDDAYDQPADERFHELRKRIKYHWYHTRLLQKAWPAKLKPHRAAAKEISDLLGLDHDLAVLAQTLRAEPEAFGRPRDVGAALALIRRAQEELREQARPIARKLLAEKPRKLAERWGAYWDAASHAPA